MIEVKQLSGILNLDSPEEDFPPFHHRYLLNGRFRGAAGNYRLEPIPGNILIPNSLLPTGNNRQNGGFFDAIKRRIIWFNYSSTGRHGIYKYDISTKQLSKIFLCFTDSATDILNFSLDYPIHSAAIIYRSDPDGDLLYWTDGLNRPRYLNIDTVSSLTPFVENMINAAKLPPLDPIVAAYANDATVNANSLRRKLFRFTYRWVYKNFEKSTLAAISKVPLPVNGYDPDTDNDSTKNNYITVPVVAGGSDCKAIEILMQVNGQSDADVPVDQWGDFQLVASIDLQQYGIVPGGLYTYNFYNNQNYTFIDPADATLYWDWIPNVAQTLESLNGNHIIYANTTDGYNSLTRSQIDVTVTSGTATANNPSIAFVYSGASSVVATIGPVITAGTTYHVQFDYVTGGTPLNKSVNYVAILGDTSDTVAAALVALLNGGFISSSVGGAGTFNILITGLSPTISNVVMTVSIAGSEVAGATYKWSCPQRLGIQYLDKWDKPVGGVYSFVSDSALDTTDFAVTTPDFITNSNVAQIPFIAATINHIPPTDAVAYHWVRAELTPKFIYWVSNDYQTDTDYLYVCIENLYFQNSQNTGFVPTYDFAKGDRVRIVASFDNTSQFFTPYSLQLDFEILGTVQRTMTFPTQDGTFLKLGKPTTFPGAPYQGQMLLDIYTPLANVPNDLLVFKEWSEKYDIYEFSPGVFYHAGMIDNQTPTQPATFQWFDGDVYYKNRLFYPDAAGSTGKVAFMMDKNYSDYFPSAVNSNGRGWLIQADARVITNEVEIRWGGGYLQDTNVNELNRFRPENIDTLDLSKGAIRRILAEKREVYFYHSRAVGSLGIYSKYIKNNQGQQQLIATDDLITKNNIYYLLGRYGLQNQPTAIFRGEDEVHYFIDCTNGDQFRRSGDGIVNLGNLYYGEYAISNLLTPYNSDYLRGDGGKARIIGYYDYFENEAHFILQGGTLNGQSIPDLNFSFNEKRNGYNGFYDFQPDAALQAASITYSWKNGELYIHNDEINWCRFYGIQYYPKITLIFNDKGAINKVFNSLGYQSEGKTWECSKDLSLNGSTIEESIITSFVNPQTGIRQTSRLKSFNFEFFNGKTIAAFLRDINSRSDRRDGLWNGDYLTGLWVQIELEYKNSDFATFYLPYMNYEISNRNF